MLTYSLPTSSLRAIAAGRAGQAELRLLRSAARSRQLLILRSLLDTTQDAGRTTRGTTTESPEEAWRLLVELEVHDPGAVGAVITDPFVRTWAMRLLRRLKGPSPGAVPGGTTPPAPLWAELGQFHALAAAAAVRARFPVKVCAPAYRGMVWLPGLGVAGPVSGRRWSRAEVRSGPDGTTVHGENGDVTLPGVLSEPGTGWQPLRPVWTEPAHPAAMLRIDTVTPYRDFVVPLRAPGRFEERHFRRWRERLDGAWTLLARHSPAESAALAELVTALVPRPAPPADRRRVASASSAEAFGAVTLSLPYDTVQTAAALVHETRHQALNALLDLVPLLEPSRDDDLKRRDALYYAPWRSDPRPPLGLLHGTYAFAGLAEFWRTQPGSAASTATETEQARFEFATAREQVTEGADALLSSGRLTEAGRVFVEEIAASAARWRREDVPTHPARLARDYCAARRATWRVRHLDIDEEQAKRIAEAWRGGQEPPALPPPVLRPRLDAIRVDNRGSLARLRVSAPASFARQRSKAERDGTRADQAHTAAIAGDYERAAHHYMEWISADPSDTEAWIGLALACPEGARPPAARMLLDRPEAVAGVYRAIVSGGGPPPDPARLAAWLARARIV